jgi:type I restriction enzyme S subunit
VVVPTEWKEVRLGEICEIYQPTTIGGKDFKESGEFVVYGANGPIGRYNRYNHEDPEVTVTCRGATCGTVNVTPPRVWITGNAMVVRPKAQTLSKLMLKYILQALDYSDVITGAAQPQITGAGLSPCQILVPPLKEQEAIAEALSDADAAIESLDALIAKKRDVKQATMQQLLTGRTRLPGFTGDWKEVRLGDLGPLSKGVGIKKNEVTPYGIPCVRYGQIYTDYNFVIGEIQTFVSPQVASNSRRLRKGEILFAGSGETKEDIGKCIAYVKDVGAVAGGDIVVLTPVGADSRFLGYSLNSPNVAQQKMSRAQGDAVVHISAANLASIVLDSPPLKEQEAIAEALTVMDDELAALTEQVSKLRMVKEGMMQDLLTGKVRLV